MKVELLGFYFKFRDLCQSEAAQDLVEYSMMVAMLGLGAVVAMQSLDAAIVQVFSNVSSTINSALTTAT